MSAVKRPSGGDSDGGMTRNGSNGDAGSSPSPLRVELGATLKLALPLLVAQAAVMLMGIVDTAVVGRFSALDLGAVSLGNSVSNGVLVFGTGFALGLEPLLSQALGNGDRGRAWAWWRAGRRLALLMGIPLTIAAIVVGALTQYVGVEPEMHDLSMEYLWARIPSMAAFGYYMAQRSFLQSNELARPLVVAAIVANLFNVLTDVLMVHGDDALIAIGIPGIGLPQWGGAGAGFATSTSTLVMISVLRRHVTRFKPLTGMEIPAIDARRLVKLGIPLGLMLAAEYAVFATVGIVAATLGATAASGHQIALQVSSLAFMAVVGIGSATATRVGLAVGSRDRHRVRRAGLAGFVLMLLVMSTTATVFWLFSTPIAHVFAPDEPDVVAVAAGLIAIAAVFQLFDGVQIVAAGALRGLGDVHAPFYLTLIGHWGVGFSVALILCFPAGMGVKGLWWGLTLGLTSVALALAGRFAIITRRDIVPVEG